MDKLILFLVSFVFVYLVYLITVISKVDKNDNFKNSKQVSYFKNVHKIDVDKINLKTFAHVTSLCNALIISLTVLIIQIFDQLFLKMMVGFVVLVPLMLLFYYIIGKIYKSKEK